MNLYLLKLVDYSLMRTATRCSLVLGAAAGAGLYLVPFLLGGPVWLRLVIGLPLAAVVMIKITFRVKSIKALLKAAEKLFLYSFLFGGVMLFGIRVIPQASKALLNVFGILGIGMIVFLILSYRKERKNAQNLCKVVLIGKETKVTVDALMDTGNGLTEPISGKPVSILEKEVFDSLWKEGEPSGFRAVPYHSIGKKRGILQGYLVPEICIEVDGITKTCKDVYVGISEEMISGTGKYKMILNPLLLEA